MPGEQSRGLSEFKFGTVYDFFAQPLLQKRIPGEKRVAIIGDHDQVATCDKNDLKYYDDMKQTTSAGSNKIYMIINLSDGLVTMTPQETRETLDL